MNPEEYEGIEEVEAIEADDNPTPVQDEPSPEEEAPVELEVTDEEDPDSEPVAPPLHQQEGSVLGVLFDEDEEVELGEDLYDGEIAPSDEAWAEVPETPELEEGNEIETEDEEVRRLADASFVFEELGLAADAPEVRYYEFQARPGTAEVWRDIARATPENELLELTDLPIAADWEFRVRTVFTNGEVSAWSAPSPVHLPDDMIPPPTPSAPQVEGVVGGINVAWDGLGDDGSQMPPDFARLVIWDSHDGTPGSWVRRSSLPGPAGILLTGYPAGTETFFAFTTLDKSGNESGMSASASASIIPVVDVEAIEAALDDAQERIDAMREWADGRFAALDARATEAEAAFANAEAELAAVQALLDTMPEATDMADAIEKARQAINQIGNLDERLAGAEALIAEKASNSRVDQIDSVISQLGTDLDVAQGRLTEAEGKITSAEGELETLGGKIVAAQAEIDSKASSQELSDLNTTLTNSFTQGINAAKIEAAITAEEKAEAAKIEAVNEAAQNAQTEYDRLQVLAERAISSTDNLIKDGGFDDPTIAAWSNAARAYWQAQGGRTSPGTYCVPAGTTNHWPRVNVPVRGGQDIYFEAYARRSAGEEEDASLASLYARYYTADGSLISGQYLIRVRTDSLPTEGWALLSTTLTTPLTAVTADLCIHSSTGNIHEVFWDDVYATDSTLVTQAVSAAEAAQSRADAAHELAGTAEANAQLAMTAAGQKTRVSYSTSAPSGTANEGDVWRRIDGNGDVYGEWVRVGNSWQSRGIRNEMISNLDVGKLTAGTADIGTAVANKLFANIFAANKITAGMIDVVPNTDEFAPNLEEYGDLWTLYNAEFRNVSLSGGAYTGRAVVFTGSDTANGQVFGPMRPIIPGRRVFFRGRYSWSGSSNTGETLYVRMEWYDTSDASSTRLGFTNLVTRDSGTSGTILEGSAVAPPEARFARLYLYQPRNSTAPGNALMMDMTCRPMIGSTIIEPGAITTEHLTVTKEMAAALVNADKGNFISLIAQDLIADNATLINAAMRNLTVAEKAKFGEAFAEAIWTNSLVAKVIETSKLSVTGQNIIADPDFQTIDNPDSLWSTGGALRNSRNGVYYLDAPNSGAVANIFYGSLSNPIPARANEHYKLTWRKRRQYVQSLETGEYNVNVSFVDWQGNHVSWHGRTHYTSVTDGNLCEFEFKVPDDDSIAGMRLYWRISTANAGYHGIYPPRLVSMADGSMIVENSITADKVVATSEMITRILGADIALVNQMVVNGNLFANHVTAMSAALQNLTVTQKANFADAFADSFMSNSAVIRELLTSRLVVAADNFAPDPGLIPEAWADSSYGYSVVSHSNSATGNAFRFGQRSGDTQIRGPIKPVRPGDVIRFRGRYTWWGGSNVGANVQLRMEWFKDPKATRDSQTTFHTIASGTGGHWAEAEVTVPDGITYARFYMYQPSTTSSNNAGFWGDLDVRSKLGGHLIVPGTIETEHLNVTEEMVAAFLRAKKIEAGEIAGNAFEGGIFTGGVFDGSVVRGGRFETHSAVDRGVKITPDGRLVVYDNDGNTRLAIGGGQFNSISGRISASEGGSLPRIVLKPSGEAQSGTGGTTNAGVFFIRDGSSGIPGLSVVAGMYVQNPANTGAESLRLRGQNGGSVVIDSDVNFDARGSRTDLGDTVIQGTTSNHGLTVKSQNGNDRLVVNNSYTDVYNNMSVPNNFSIRSSRSTSTGNANLHMDSNGMFYTTSSASRYKLDQQVLDVPDALLDLDVKTWVDKHVLDRKAEAEAKREAGEELDWIDEADLNPTLERGVGVIAEDVERLAPEFAIHDSEGRIESVAYDRLAMAAFPLIRRQRDRINDLESTVSTLEARLAALEAKLDD